MRNVLVIGDGMLDRYWFGDVERISPEAPVPVLKVERDEWRLGGAANVAHGCVALGASATLRTVVGADQEAQRLAKLCLQAGIVLDGRVDEAVPTTVKLRLIGRSQQMVRADFEAPAQRHRPAPITGNPDVIVISDYRKGAVSLPGSLMAMCMGTGVRALVDTKTDDYTEYRGCYLLKQNVPEFEASARGSTPEQVRRAIGAHAVLITRAAQGMSLYTENGERHIASEARQVFDVTGAGDTVMAALAVFLAEGAALDRAVSLANQAAGIAVGKFGTSVVTREELGL